MELPKPGDWVGFLPDSSFPSQWFWGKVTRRLFRDDKWLFTLDTGSMGIQDFYLHSLVIPEELPLIV